MMNNQVEVVDYLYVITYRIIYIVLLIIIFKFLNMIINKIVDKAVKSKFGAEEYQRGETVKNILHDLTRYSINIILVIGILIAVGVDFKLLLTTIGVSSVIIGIAAQSLIIDMINGFFTVFEGYYDIGDFIEINNFEGEVVSLGIKTTTLKDTSNRIITIPNSKVSEIINYSKMEYDAFIDYKVSSYEDVNKVEELINGTLINRVKDYEYVNDFSYLGVGNFEQDNFQIKFSLVTNDADRFEAHRMLNREMKILFEENNIKQPVLNIGNKGGQNV